MDIVLDLADYLFFDILYAKLFPPIGKQPAVRRTPTFSSAREAPTPIHYQLATQFLKLGRSSFTHSSSLPRDNVYRQALSLYLITWFGPTRFVPWH